MSSSVSFGFSRLSWGGLRTFWKSCLGSTLPPGERLVFFLSVPKQPNTQRPSHHKHSFLLPHLWVSPRLFPCVFRSSLSRLYRAPCNPWQELAPSFLAPSFDFDPLHLPPLKFKFNWLWHHVWLLRVTRQSGRGVLGLRGHAETLTLSPLSHSFLNRVNAGLVFGHKGALRTQFSALVLGVKLLQEVFFTLGLCAGILQTFFSTILTVSSSKCAYLLLYFMVVFFFPKWSETKRNKMEAGRTPS